MNLKSKIHRISCFPYRHEGRSREILLALCSFLLLSQKVSPFPLSHIGRYTPYRHFERSREIFLARWLSCRIALLVCMFPTLSHTHHFPFCYEDPSTSLGMTMRMALCSRYFHAATPKSASSRHIDPSLWSAPSLRRAKKGS